eukprot:COSAG05_NODE_1268_length_5325_cov_2.029085_2_plen_383_part_00
MPQYTVQTGKFSEGKVPVHAPIAGGDVTGDVTFFQNPQANGGGTGIKVRLAYDNSHSGVSREHKWHIHQGRCITAAQPSGGHYTGSSSVSGSSTCCIESGQCDLQNVTGMVATCWAGDLSGKFGKFNITDNANDTEITFIDRTGTIDSADLLVNETSIVIHEADSASPLACGTIVAGSGEFFKSTQGLPRHYAAKSWMPELDAADSHDTSTRWQEALKDTGPLGIDNQCPRNGDRSNQIMCEQGKLRPEDFELPLERLCLRGQPHSVTTDTTTGDILVTFPQETISPSIKLRAGFFDGTGTLQQSDDLTTEGVEQPMSGTTPGTIILVDHLKPQLTPNNPTGHTPLVFVLVFGTVVAVGLADKFGLFASVQSAGLEQPMMVH